MVCEGGKSNVVPLKNDLGSLAHDLQLIHMTRIAWLTDLHLEFLRSPQEIDAFSESIIAASPDCILIGGDTSIAPYFERDILRLTGRIQVPIYFVLGNHDFYEGSIKQVRMIAEGLTKTSQWLRWLPVEGIVELAANTGLIGHDSWADGRLGNGVDSQVSLNDYFLVDELTNLTTTDRFRRLNALGDEAANFFQELLPSVLKRFRNVIILTHVPPFRDACWHEGKISDDEFLPHFTCQAVGDVLFSIMQRHPQCSATILCGHTHGHGEATILPNLHVKTGGAEYGQPKVQEVLVAE